ncbi:MAG: type IV toxin-antitoxin system AbiEi family antitoxin [Acidobacteriota bacterium]
MKNEAVRSKLRKLLVHWPKGTVVAQSWLREQGISRQLAEKYRASDWIQRIGRGAYTRTGEKTELLGAVYTLQAQLRLPVHVGAKTALELQGYAHFLPMKEIPRVHLYGRPGRRLPAWFQRHSWGSQVRLHLAQLFPTKPDLGLTKKEQGDYFVRLSAPERAAFELVDLVPTEESFEGAQLLLESLTTLRPDLVQELLESCHSVKAKRLFLYFVEKCGHAWLKRLDLQRVDLGKGNRQIVRGGRLDTKYQITVPAEAPQEVP